MSWQYTKRWAEFHKQLKQNYKIMPNSFLQKQITSTEIYAKEKLIELLINFKKIKSILDILTPIPG